MDFFEIFTHYPLNSSSHWNRKHFQYIIYNDCREKRMALMASTLSSQNFLLIFLVFACNCCRFHSHRTYYDDLLML